MGHGAMGRGVAMSREGGRARCRGVAIGGWVGGRGRGRAMDRGRS